MIKYFLITVLFLNFTLTNVFCEEIYDPNKYLQSKSFCEKISFWKKIKRKKNQKPKGPLDNMPKTKQQWEKISESEPTIERENPRKPIEPNKKLTTVLPPDAFFVKYNSPPGEAEVDISKITKTSAENSEGVINENFNRMAYVSYYYYPSTRQISSKLYVLPLDTSKTRIKRVENANILKASRINNFEVNMDNVKFDYDSFLTILDWSKDSDFLLVKKKDGSSKSGLFRTTLYKVYVDDSCENLGYIKIDFEKNIKNYWKKKSNLVLNLYRWDIKPLGFNAEDENEVITYAWGYDKNGNKIFLGTWGADLRGNKVYLISEDYLLYEIASHGIILKYQLP